MPTLRDDLIKAAFPYGSMAKRAKQAADLLFIDMNTSGSIVVTRVSQAMVTLQTFLHALRTRQVPPDSPYTNLSMVDDQFDAQWQWRGSYAAWRAAMFVQMYPENILLPSLIKAKSYGFRRLIDELRKRRTLTPEQACDIAQDYGHYLRDVCNLTLEASCYAPNAHGGEVVRNP